MQMKPTKRMLITVFLGFLGVHKFMDGKIGMGFLYLFTMGLGGIGWIVDSCKAVSMWCKWLVSPNKHAWDSVSSNSKRYKHANNTITSKPTSEPEPVYNFNQPYDDMDGHTFEHYCADLLTENGYENVEVTKGSGDQGLDVIAYRDGVKYGIQCKCYSSDIGNKAVQEAFAGKTYYNCHVAAVLTNRHFTKSAKELAESNKVLLWDREKLEEFVQNSHCCNTNYN